MNQHDTDIQVFEEVTNAVSERLPRNLRLRRSLPGGGRLRIDRQLPFLCVYRIPPNANDAGTRELVTTEAAYLVVPGDEHFISQTSCLCRTICKTALEHFGLFLIIEIRSKPFPPQRAFPVRPRFRLVFPEAESLPSALDAFRSAMEEIQINQQPSAVITDDRPTDQENLSSPLQTVCSDNPVCFWMGIDIEPIYRHPQTGEVYPLVLQQFRRQLARAIRHGVATLVGSQGQTIPPHFDTFGPSSMVKAVRLVDQELSDVSEAFDFLLQVTPVNGDQAWEEFQASHYQSTPTFYYRPLPYDPTLLKRRLFNIPIERVEDPTLAHLFAEKQTELDRQLSALCELERPEFLLSSLKLYGDVETSLKQLALRILDVFPTEPIIPVERYLSPQEVAASARDEIDYYHQQAPIFTPVVEICDHIAAGIMVSRERLLISERLQVRPERLMPLLHHEIGTHLVTYFNGRNQPFRQLSTGLAGYEPLQEGLAVLSEYLSDGLSRSRLRRLAARVIAVASVIDGAEFVETFRLLHRDHGFSARSAYTTTLRVHRGGGFTKDVVYLRGLQDVLVYLREGHGIEPLYVGKIGLEHVLFIQELRRREIIQPPSLLPRFYEDKALQQRLDECRKNPIFDLLELN